jgi:hypothetical protein
MNSFMSSERGHVSSDIVERKDLTPLPTPRSRQATFFRALLSARCRPGRSASQKQKRPTGEQQAGGTGFGNNNSREQLNFRDLWPVVGGAKRLDQSETTDLRKPHLTFVGNERRSSGMWKMDEWISQEEPYRDG